MRNLSKMLWKIILYLTIVFMVGCSEPERVITLEIDDSVSQMLYYLGYENCSILSLGDYYSCRQIPDVVSNEAIDEVISRYCDLHPCIEVLDKRRIEENDLVIISYEIIADSYVYMSAERQVVKAGKVNFDTLIEQSVMGKTVGESYCIDYVNSNLQAENIKCYITPQYIYTVSDAVLNDTFVNEHLGYSTVDEWRKVIKSDIAQNNLENAWATVIDSIIEISSFQFDEECIFEHATNLAFQTAIAAEQEKLSLGEYTQQEYNMSEEEFYDMCYLSSAREVKEYLIIGAIAFAEKIYINDKDIENYCIDNEIDINNVSDEYRLYINYYILRDIIMQKLCSE